MSEAIGWLGGTFDPPHHGHSQLARDALKYLPLTELRLVPAGQPWQKSTSVLPDARAAMVELAIAAEEARIRKRMVLDTRELQRDGPTYTVDTARELRASSPKTALIFVMGADQFERFDTWHDWPAIVELTHLAIARRADRAPQLNATLQALVDQRRCDDPQRLLDQPAGYIADLPMTPVDISSTELRQLLAAPRSQAVDERLGAMVAPKVLDYIRTHHLYSARNGH